MDLTIIIVNWNAGDMLRDCLESIRRSKAIGTTRVVVMDNASKDGSREMAEREFPEFRTINTGANLGFGKANNLARPYCDTPYVMFLNPDTLVVGDALERMVQFLKEHPDVGGLGPRMLYPNGGTQELGTQWFPSPWTEFLGMFLVSSGSRRRFRRYLPEVDANKSQYVSKIYGGCLIAPKTVLDQAGWFDERYFMYAEDVDLSRTILDLGKKLYYLAEAHIVHVGAATSDKAPSGFSVLMKCESISKLNSKYYGWLGGVAHRLAVLTGSLFRLLILSLMRLVSWVVPVGRGIDYRSGFFKYRLMILWCLNLRRARPAS